MATPVGNSVPLLTSVNNNNGTLTDEFISGLVQSSSWSFAGGPRVLTYSFDLNFDGAQTRRNFTAQSLAIDNVPAFDRDDFIFANMGGGKQSAPMDFALAHFRLWGAVRKRCHHDRLIVEALVPSAFRL